MKLLTYLADNGPRVAILTSAGVEDIIPETGDAYAVIAAGGIPKTGGKPTPLASVKLLAPIAELKRPVIAIGLNYKKHADESARKTGEWKVGTYPESPVFFSKWPGSHSHDHLGPLGGFHPPAGRPDRYRNARGCRFRHGPPRNPESGRRRGMRDREDRCAS